MKREIERFLEQFPTDATSWAQATDEVRDLARLAREHLEEYDGVIVEPVDFRHAKTLSLIHIFSLPSTSFARRRTAAR